MQVIGKCDIFTRLQLDFLHEVLVRRMREHGMGRPHMAPKLEQIIKTLQDVKVVMSDTLRTTAGRAHCGGKNQIDLHRRLLNGRIQETEMTYIHEFAHLVAFDLFGVEMHRAFGPHGRPWRYVMEMLKAKPDVKHAMDVAPYRRAKFKTEIQGTWKEAA